MKKKNTEKFYSKEIKRNKTMNEDVQRVITFIVVLVIVLGLLGGLYFLNGKYVTKDLFQGDVTTTTTEVSYDPTLLTVSRLFDVKSDEYYVMMYDHSDKVKATLYDSLVLNFKEVDISLYTVDMSNAMNNKYYDVDGKENKAPTKSEEVMVTRPTLVHIKKGKVVEYITEDSKMVEKLTENREKKTTTTKKTTTKKKTTKKK